MDKPTRLLSAGILTGLFLIGLGAANDYRLEQNVEELVNKCLSERQRESKAPGTPGAFGGILVCEPQDLAKGDHLAPGVQGELARAQRLLNARSNWLYFLGASIAAVLALPWGWYFLLNRIKELREAVIGK
jgi:hypothetical protein